MLYGIIQALLHANSYLAYKLWTECFSFCVQKVHLQLRDGQGGNVIAKFFLEKMQSNPERSFIFLYIRVTTELCKGTLNAYARFTRNTFLFSIYIAEFF